VSDPSTDLVKATAEGVTAGAVGEFIDKLGGFGVESGDLIRDHVRFVRAKAQLTMYEKTMAILQERNIPVHRVAWKILFPLLDFSSLEDERDAEMIDRWAALLANAAAGPDRGATVLPSFPRILSELSSQEAAILNVLYTPPDPAQVPGLYHLYPDDPRLDRRDPMFYTRCFNLDRLGLLLATWENAQIGDTNPPRYVHKVHYLEGKALGLSFVVACTPPS
jgi:Abortive infection alpha